MSMAQQHRSQSSIVTDWLDIFMASKFYSPMSYNPNNQKRMTHFVAAWHLHSECTDRCNGNRKLKMKALNTVHVSYVLCVCVCVCVCVRSRAHTSPLQTHVSRVCAP